MTRFLQLPSAAACFTPTETGSWFVLRTKSRQEKVLSADLDAMGVKHFLPLMITSRCYAGRDVEVTVPIFSGYLFLYGNRDDTFLADRTRRIAQILPVLDQPRLHSELWNLFRLLDSDEVFDPFPHIRNGLRVRVRSGKLEGVEGVVQGRNDLNKLLVQIDFLRQGVALPVDGSQLELID